MQTRGINYDTGFVIGGRDSRPGFDTATAARELQIIADDLHCTAVRISGGHPDRIEAAARGAADAGLQVWFAPFPIELELAATREVIADSAERAERLRRDGADVVLVTGCELSLFAAGLLPGDTFMERASGLMAGGAGESDFRVRTQSFLDSVQADSRRTFGGPLTYASGIWEDLDWSAFDIMSVDAYQDENVAPFYTEQLRYQRRHGKPVAITEFGCCTYRGAGARGGLGWLIGKPGPNPNDEPTFDGSLVRDEQEQVDYFTTSMRAFEAAGIEAAFWFTFASYNTVRRDDPTHDLDLAAYGVVAMLDGRPGTTYSDMSWEPKQVFHTMAETYGRSAAGSGGLPGGRPA